MRHPPKPDTPGHGTLPQLGIAIAARLQRLGLDQGSEYLAGARARIDTLQTEIVNTRRLIGELVLQAATAEDSQALKDINNHVVEAGHSMFMSLRSVPMIQGLCTAVRDAIAGRALELAGSELFHLGASNDAPCALMAVGSHGRGEQTLVTDQDYLFVHGDSAGGDAASAQAASEYFGTLGSVFVRILEEAGIRKCSSGIMPDNEAWRGSNAQWRRRLFAPPRLQHDDWAKNILHLIILSDARHISGDPDLTLGFGPFIRSQVRENHQTIRSMARVASAMRLATGFFRRFDVAAEGPNKGAFNLKLLAWKPLVTCVRVLAVNFDVDTTSTLERIEVLQGKGIFSEKMASGLAESYHIITGRRILQQIKKIKGIIDDDEYINPYELVGGEREELYQAIVRVADLQRMIQGNFSVA